MGFISQGPLVASLVYIAHLSEHLHGQNAFTSSKRDIFNAEYDSNIL